MKSNTREIKMLVVLLVLLASVLFYRYRVMPKVEQIKNTKIQIEQNDALVRGLYTNVAAYPTSVEKLKQLKSELKTEAENYYVLQEQEVYVDTIIQWCKDTSMSIISMNCQEPTKLELYVDRFSVVNPYQGKSDSFENPINEYYVELRVEGKYKDYQKLVSTITDAEKVMISTDSNVSRKSDSIKPKSGEETGTFVLDLRFLNIDNMPALTNEEIPQMDTSFVMPASFIDQSYQSLMPKISFLTDLFHK